MRKACMEMPIKPRSCSPKAANAISMMPPVMQARSAIVRRRAWLMPWVNARNIGVRPGGSMITKSVTKAVMRKALSIEGL